MTRGLTPRAGALVTIAIGAAVTLLMVALGGTDAGGRSGGKAAFLMGIGSLAFGIGLMQLAWPPPPRSSEHDERNFFSRASWPQKTLYVLGGLGGVVAAAILQTISSGKL